MYKVYTKQIHVYTSICTQKHTRHTHLPNLWPHSQDYAVVAVGVGDKGDRGRGNIKAFGLLFIDNLLVFNLTPAGKKPELGYSIHCDG